MRVQKFYKKELVPSKVGSFAVEFLQFCMRSAAKASQDPLLKPHTQRWALRFLILAKQYEITWLERLQVGMSSLGWSGNF
jgi:hypothetical protein